MENNNNTNPTRRDFLFKSAAVGALLSPNAHTGAVLNVPSTPRGIKKLKIKKIEAVFLTKPLKERFWMALSPIGGYSPKATRIIVYVHTDQGVVGRVPLRRLR